MTVGQVIPPQGASRPLLEAAKSVNALARKIEALTERHNAAAYRTKKTSLLFRVRQRAAVDQEPLVDQFNAEFRRYHILLAETEVIDKRPLPAPLPPLTAEQRLVLAKRAMLGQLSFVAGITDVAIARFGWNAADAARINDYRRLSGDAQVIAMLAAVGERPVLLTRPERDQMVEIFERISAGARRQRANAWIPTRHG